MISISPLILKRREYQRRYYADNPKRFHGYYINKKDIISKKRAKHYEENREGILKQKAEWYSKNRLDVLERRKKK